MSVNETRGAVLDRHRPDSEDHHSQARRDAVVVVWGPCMSESLLGEMKERLPLLLDTPPAAVVVDLSGMTRLSSGAVAALLWVGGVCRRRGVPVRLVHVPRWCVRTLRDAGLRAALAPDEVAS